MEVFLGNGTGWAGDALADRLLHVENVIGSNVADSLAGGTGANQLNGGYGSDTLRGDDGDDDLFGEAGNDTLFGGLGKDQLDGGAGTDWADYSGDSTSVEVSLHGREGEKGSAEGDSCAGIENVRGGNGADILWGDIGADVLNGNGGADQRHGGLGLDVLMGGGGADRMDGHSGQDDLYGGSNADRFIFSDSMQTGVGAGQRDIVADFSKSEGDKIDIDGIDADWIINGNQDFTFVGTDAFQGWAEIRYTHAAGNTIISGNVTGGTGTDFQIQLNGLTAGDFLL